MSRVKQAFLGVDIGGTNTRIGIVTDSLELLFPCRIIKSQSFAWTQNPVEALADLLKTYIRECMELGTGETHMEVCAAAVSVPASVSSDFCTVYEAPNLKNKAGRPIFDNMPLGRELQRRMGIPVYIDKDVNFLLRHDIQANGLKGIVVGCYIGTGLGSAVSIDGKMLYGRHGYAMDCGHLPLFHEQGICGCGKAGCVETVTSGAALSRLKEKYYPDTPFAELFTRHKEEKPLQTFVRDMAYTPAALLTVFDPDALILGGGVIEMDQFPRRELENEILALTEKAIASSHPPIYYAERKPERGVIGGALFVDERMV